MTVDIVVQKPKNPFLYFLLPFVPLFITKLDSFTGLIKVRHVKLTILVIIDKFSYKNENLCFDIARNYKKHRLFSFQI